MRARRKTTTTCYAQLSLFENDLREKSDKELIEIITPQKAEQVADEWEYSYSMERLYNSLAPKTRRIAAATVELYKRREAARLRSTRNSISSSKSLHDLMRPLIGDLGHEEFWVIPMGNGFNCLSPVRVSSGCLTMTMADIRIIFNILLARESVCFSVAHNHPSGFTRPSAQDDSLTQQIKNAADIMQVRMIDHIIVGAGDEYYSYHDNGRI